MRINGKTDAREIRQNELKRAIIEEQVRYWNILMEITSMNSVQVMIVGEKGY